MPDPSRILLVDDDSAFQSVMTRAFERRGWETASAQDAEAALALGRDMAEKLLANEIGEDFDVQVLS